MSYLEKTINRLYEIDSCDTHTEVILCVKDAAEMLSVYLDQIGPGLAATEVADMLEALYNFDDSTDISEIIHELELINMEI